MNTAIKHTSVKRYRQFAGFTQRSISKSLGMPLSTYQQKEQGRISFSDYEKEEIRNLISEKVGNTSIDAIFFG